MFLWFTATDGLHRAALIRTAAGLERSLGVRTALAAKLLHAGANLLHACADLVAAVGFGNVQMSICLIQDSGKGVVVIGIMLSDAETGRDF